MIDLTPTAKRTSAVAAAVTDDQLDAPTPMGEPVRVVLHHVLGLATAFRDAARKETGATVSTAPTPQRGPLPDGWRNEIDQGLTELAEAWQSADAWTGMTMAGGVQLPGEVGGLIALNEVLLHGWDVARATGQPYRPTEPECEAVLPIVTRSRAIRRVPVATVCSARSSPYPRMQRPSTACSASPAAIRAGPVHDEGCAPSACSAE